MNVIKTDAHVLKSHVNRPKYQRTVFFNCGPLLCYYFFTQVKMEYPALKIF